MKWTPSDVWMKLKDRSRETVELARTHPRRTRAAVTVAIVAVVLGALVLPFAVGDDARHLSAFADGKQDVSGVRRVLDGVTERSGGSVQAFATSAYFVDSVRNPQDHVLMVFGVERDYTDGETDAVLDFVAAGGTLVLANDVGNGNRLAREFGVLFGDKVVLDDKRNYLGDPRFVDVVIPLDGRDHRVLLNAPTHLVLLADPPQPVTVLARSSDESYIDVDEDGAIDIRDTAQSFPLVAETRYGDGRVLLVADTGLFMNDMLEVPGYENGGFVGALARSTLTGRANVLIDESRHSPPPAAAAGNAGLRILVIATSTPVWNAALGALALVGVAAAVVATRDTEDWSEHPFNLGESVETPRNVAPTPERLQALAKRAISENFNIPIEYLDSAPFEELVRLTNDRELVAVATGKDRAHPSKSLYERLTQGAPTTTVIPQEA